MHPEVYDFVGFVKNKYPNKFNKVKVLEVGSQNINGSVRPHFINCDYLGIDLGEAPGVDLVLDATKMKFKEEFDTVISGEALEHCEGWEIALANMYNALKPGGLLVITAAGPNRHEHGTHNHTSQDSKFTLDWYRNISVEDIESVLPSNLFTDYHVKLYRGDCDIYMYGIKNL